MSERGTQERKYDFIFCFTFPFQCTERIRFSWLKKILKIYHGCNDVDSTLSLIKFPTLKFY